jgi:hypothetical protein
MHEIEPSSSALLYFDAEKDLQRYIFSSRHGFQPPHATNFTIPKNTKATVAKVHIGHKNRSSKVERSFIRSSILYRVEFMAKLEVQVRRGLHIEANVVE